MNGSADIKHLLDAWPYDPENDTRLVTGSDGRQLLQVRTPMGIEQYEMEGRPDGVRPHGLESALDYYLQRLERARQQGKEAEFELNSRQCGELFSEGTLFYFRYVRLFQLKDWARTIRDTARNLKAFDFVHRYASREEDQLFLEKWRPYILRVNGTAAAMRALEDGNFDVAIKGLEDSIRRVEMLDELDDETFKFERDRSLVALRELLAQVEKNRPMSALEKLEQQLSRAIEAQEFERAAQLRDRIRSLKGTG